jgi:hypothetical protein
VKKSCSSPCNDQEEWGTDSATTEFEEVTLENMWKEAQGMELKDFQNTFSEVLMIAKYQITECVWTEEGTWRDMWIAAYGMSVEKFCRYFTVKSRELKN